MSELPDDVVDEILCRVPATSLKRLRYTCKRWNCLFNDREFTRQHFHKARKESLILILKNSQESPFRFHSMSINLHRSPTVEITCEFNLINPHSSLDHLKIYKYCHSSDGLVLCVCVSNMDKNARLVVWNPCTVKPSGSNPEILASTTTIMFLDPTKTTNPATIATKY
ncbi:putative F-box protein [Cardamine amara subsp. amara]|uniref:F-box protein n=1 Tax=Cardamine amara subsp. amara TaxID=228776 RepID=A0ABD1A3E3_CARAN